MHQRVHPAVAVVVLAAVVLLAVRVTAPSLLRGPAPEAFPPGIVAAAGQPPNIYADRPEVRVTQLIESMDAMWARAFAAAGDRYDRPRVEARAGEAGQGCGSGVRGWAGVYCSDGHRIVIDVADHLVMRAATGDERSDDLLGYVLAHEVGHHVQALRGTVATGDPDALLRSELQAECLAGVWGRAAGRALPPAWSYTSDAAHGTAAQQRRWLERGHARARPADCDGVWSDGAP